VIRARKRLASLGYLDVKKQSEDLRKSRLVSKPQPFVDYAGKRVETRRSLRGKRNLDDAERDVLFRIADSQWFRRSLDEDVRYKTTYEGALQAIAEFLEMVCTITVVLSTPCRASPDESDVLDYASFDEFMNVWHSKRIEPRHQNKEIIAQASSQLLKDVPRDPKVRLLVSNTLEKPPYPALCIPFFLAEKLCTIGRTPLTLFLYLSRAFKSRQEQPSVSENL
jgi:hypothetical protein